MGMNELGKWDERDNDGLLLSFSMEEKMIDCELVFFF